MTHQAKRRRLSTRRLTLWVAVLALAFALIGRPDICANRDVKGVWFWSHGTKPQDRGVLLFAVYWVRCGWPPAHYELIVWHDTTRGNIALGAGWWPKREAYCMTWYHVGDGGGPWR